ncbi:TetR/AcrR family transcriptional regulator [Alteraurantiacibacter buctensis]|uniref:TetR family transcriptional regulator n=1 Tax=Alteraurantiacibacter buctensis TaxID=1503981 RepID=A0A844Z0I4_9SPHN|nr:TetR family transcriptional regulator [Alteraurantiacibacter buctensis]MXO73319.1 TetR family transcriptional regulator [Alteraurantiacibacter buctensis]
MNPATSNSAPGQALQRGERRPAIARAALEVLGRHGSRGLTHRAIDQHLGLPMGTTSAYFRRREDLVGAAIRALFKADSDRFTAMVGDLLASGEEITLETVVRFFVRMIRHVRDNTPEVIQLARYECFLLARRDEELKLLLKAQFDARERRDAELFARLGATDPVRSATRFGITVRGAFFTLAFFPEPSMQVDELDESFIRNALIAAMA